MITRLFENDRKKEITKQKFGEALVARLYRDTSISFNSGMGQIVHAYIKAYARMDQINTEVKNGDHTNTPEDDLQYMMATREADLLESINNLFDAAWEEFVEVDPTPVKQCKYIPWIVNRYINGGIQRWEDMERAQTALDNHYDMVTRKVFKNSEDPSMQALADINKFPNLSSLEMKIREIEKSNTDMNAADRRFVQNISKFAADGGLDLIWKSSDNKTFVVCLNTIEASTELFAQRVLWCTAPQGNRNFDSHRDDGPLYAFAYLGDDEYYQLHRESNQFMDKKDDPIKLESTPMSKEIWVEVARHQARLNGLRDEVSNESLYDWYMSYFSRYGGEHCLRDFENEHGRDHPILSQVVKHFSLNDTVKNVDYINKLKYDWFAVTEMVEVGDWQGLLDMTPTSNEQRRYYHGHNLTAAISILSNGHYEENAGFGWRDAIYFTDVFAKVGTNSLNYALRWEIINNVDHMQEWIENYSHNYTENHEAMTEEDYTVQNLVGDDYSEQLMEFAYSNDVAGFRTAVDHALREVYSQDIMDALRRGVEDYFTSPFEMDLLDDYDEIITTVTSVLKRVDNVNSIDDDLYGDGSWAFVVNDDDVKNKTKSLAFKGNSTTRITDVIFVEDIQWPEIDTDLISVSDLGQDEVETQWNNISNQEIEWSPNNPFAKF